MHILDIVGDAGDQTAYGIAREEGQRKVHNAVEEFQPQIVHDPVTGVFHDQALQEIEHEIQANQEQEGGRDPDQAAQVRMPQSLERGRGQLLQVGPGDARRLVRHLEEIAITFHDAGRARIFEVHD